MIDQLKPLIGKLAFFAQQKMGFARPPKLFLKNDKSNAGMPLGKTAYYDPDQKSVTLFVSSRHPKDILRSFAHELVHHTQNLRGDLSAEKMGSMGANYAQENDHMRNMEMEAYLQGNMCFRDWEDSLSDEEAKKYKIAESKFLKESKTMTTKITKEFLKETIRKIIEEQIGIPEKDVRVVASQVIKALSSGRKDFPASYVSGMQKRLLKLNTDEADRLVKGLAKAAMGNVRGAEGFDVQAAERSADEQIAARKYQGNKAGRGIADLYGDKMRQASSLREEEIEEGDGSASTVAPGHYCIHHGGIQHEGKIVAAEAVQHVEPDENGFISHYDMMLEDGTILEDVSASDIQITNATLESNHGRRGDDHKPMKPKKKAKMEENEELEEKKGKKKPGLKNPKKADLNKDGKLSSYEKKRGKAIEKSMASESKVQTPEEENTLYEQRFTPKNNRLYEKLVKQWTK